MKWRIFGSISCLTAALGSVWACTSSSSSSADSGGLAGACSRVANATSAFAQKCGASLTAVGASDHDTHDIEQSAALCVAKYSLPGIPDQTTNLNACASALGLAACNTEGVLAACALPTTGTLTDGTTCVQNNQCAGGLCIFSTSDAGSAAADAAAISCGTCVTATAPGQPCTDPTLCASGDCSGNPSVCEPLPTETGAIGDPCGDFNGCAPPGFCNYDSTGNSGTCAASAKVGESCQGSTPCEPQLVCANSVCTQPGELDASCTSIGCGAGLYCSGERCLGTTYGPPGASCNGSALQCVRGTCPNSSPFGPPTSACPAIIAVGQPCNPSVSVPACDTFSTCNNGICSFVPSSTGCQ